MEPDPTDESEGTEIPHIGPSMLWVLMDKLDVESVLVGDINSVSKCHCTSAKGEASSACFM
jgi:hypothetical protein